MGTKNELIDKAAALISKQERRSNPFPAIDDVALVEQSGREILLEGQWIKSPYEGSIRLDRPTYGAGDTHAHVYGRKGNEIGVVNFDGTASHGTKCRLPSAAADALRSRGFPIPASNIVEWIVLNDPPRFLFETST